MPRVASNHKQKNRKFKGAGKSKKQAHVKENGKTKTIAKSRAPKKINKIQRLKEQKEKKTKEIERLSAANEYLDAKTKGNVTQRLKNQNEVRIVLLVPCN